jgi:RNA polymerase sigma-70 factor (ECF subfamily)
VILVTATREPKGPPDTAFEVPVQPVGAAVSTTFEAVYQQHYRDVYRYVLLLTRSHHDAEEIAAETFVRAFGAWQPSAPANALPWLLLTARRIATDRWRRARRFVEHIAERPTQVEFERTEFWLWFVAVSRVLTDRQREVLLLRYQRDLSDDDIATVMGLTRSGVRSLAARALETLRAHPELL